MSIAIMSHVWAHSKFESGFLLILLAMADFSNDDGICWPGVPKLAKKARMSERNVQRCLRELEAAGEIKVIKQGGMIGAKRRASVYKIMRGEKLSPGDAHVARPVTPTSGQSSIEPPQPPNPLKGEGAKFVLPEPAEAIYAEYPLHVGKPAALRAIRKALVQVGWDVLLAKTQAFATARKGDTAFMPHPATWFGQQRYNDDPSTWTSNGSHQKKPAESSRNLGTANAGHGKDYAKFEGDGAKRAARLLDLQRPKAGGDGDKN